ncbi:MAG: hypothetical protein PHP54_04710 [Clostridia bacterium]|nr:hypothetical protein [Clostridia bacterium]
MKKFFIYLLLFFAIGTIITVIGLSVVDNFIYSLGQTSAVTVGEEKKNNNETIKTSSGIKIEDGAESLQYTYNNKYYAYLKENKVYINTTKDGKNHDVIEEKDPICYYNILYDKNLVIYFTAKKTTTTNTKLQINTYDIANKRKNEYNVFNVQNFSKIKDMNMSPVINIIYINVETKTTSRTNNIIYRVDLFNSMSQVKSGSIINQMIMLQRKDRVYYEDSNKNVYSSAGALNIFKTDVELIGIDEDDSLYFLSSDIKNIVYKVTNNKIVNTIKLSDTDVIKTYTNNVGTYLIYPTYIINVASKDPYRRIGRLSKYVNFEAIKGDTMYLRTSDNILVTTKVLVDDDTTK